MKSANTSRKATLVLTACGILITCIGSVLVSRNLTQIGQPVRVSGMVVALLALSMFLVLSFAQRYSRSQTRLPSTFRTPHSRTSSTFVVVAARVTSLLLILLSAIAFVVAVFQLINTINRQSWFGMFGFYAFGPIVVLGATGLALWLLADISERLDQKMAPPIDKEDLTRPG